MPDAIADGIWTSPQVDGPPRYSAPLPHTSALYVVEQDYVCDWDNFTPQALNTAFDLDGSYKLVFEGDPQNAGAAVRRWTRRYAQVPGSWTDAGGDYAYNFIAISEVAALPQGRNSQVLEVPLRIQRDYFLVGSGGTYADYAAMVGAATIPQQTYTLTLYPSAYATRLTAIGADTPTTPSAEQYLGWVAAGTEIAVDTSVFSRWMGNIFVRETRYVKAR